MPCVECIAPGSRIIRLQAAQKYRLTMVHKLKRIRTMLKLLNRYYDKPTYANAQKLIDYADKHLFAITGLTPMQYDAFQTIRRNHLLGN